jgi:CheY-like chemotaxis protein
VTLAPSERPTVLVVDDDPKVARLIRASLGAEGYEVLHAADGVIGVEMVETEQPDMVLLDVMMPRMDGWEMLRRVQERHGVGTIPVLMFSGKVAEEDLADAASRGASGFIGKPFDPQQLIESAKQLLPT